MNTHMTLAKTIADPVARVSYDAFISQRPGSAAFVAAHYALADAVTHANPARCAQWERLVHVSEVEEWLDSVSTSAWLADLADADPVCAEYVDELRRVIDRFSYRTDRLHKCVCAAPTDANAAAFVKVRLGECTDALCTVHEFMDGLLFIVRKRVDADFRAFVAATVMATVPSASSSGSGVERS